MSPRKSPDIPTLSGVYQIVCKPNGKIYVGSAINLRWRWHSHRRDLGNGVHVNPHLQFAWNLYGETNFEFSVLEYVDEQRLLTTEQLWITKQVALIDGSVSTSSWKRQARVKESGEPGTAFVAQLLESPISPPSAVPVA
jgi:group I intron endonuclease